MVCYRSSYLVGQNYHYIIYYDHTIFIPGTFHLVCGSCSTPQEVLGKTAIIELITIILYIYNIIKLPTTHYSTRLHYSVCKL